MNNQFHMTSVSMLIAAATGFATAGSLDLERSYASELKADAGARAVLNQGNLSNLEVSAGVRFSYSYNSRSGSGLGDDDITMGFQLTEVEVAIEGDVTDNMHARISFGFGPDNTDMLMIFRTEGPATLEDAFVDWEVNEDMTIRIGQFIPAFSSDASTSEFNMMNSYRSVTHEFLGAPSWTQGVEAHWGAETWGLVVGFNDGPASSNTAFNSVVEADYSLNARFDFYSDSDKGRFDDQTSWRGASTGWRVGAGVMWSSTGDTNPSAFVSTDELFFTVDAAYEGDGWAAHAAFYYTDIEDVGAGEHSNMGFELGGSYFVSDQWELFGRWDMLILDDDAGANQTTGEDTFNFVSFGANYYFVPSSQAAKFTLEIGISLDETADIANPRGDTNTLPLGALGSFGSSGFFQDETGEDGQVMISGTMQWLF